MTALRKEMIREMELSYLASVSGLAKHYMQSPDQVTKETMEDYFLCLKQDKGRASNTIGSVIVGLRFFYNHVVCQEHLAPNNPFGKKPRKLPTVLTKAQIWKILNAPKQTIIYPCSDLDQLYPPLFHIRSHQLPITPPLPPSSSPPWGTSCR